jgi:hypothetical protein
MPGAPSRRGYRRNETRQARTLALLDTIGVTKRPRNLDVYISPAAHEALFVVAEKRGVSARGLAAFFIETKLREDRCRAGHDLTPDNVVMERDGTRRCRACRRAYDKMRNARARA